MNDDLLLQVYRFHRWNRLRDIAIARRWYRVLLRNNRMRRINPTAYLNETAFDLRQIQIMQYELVSLRMFLRQKGGQSEKD